MSPIFSHENTLEGNGGRLEHTPGWDGGPLQHTTLGFQKLLVYAPVLVKVSGRHYKGLSENQES